MAPIIDKYDLNEESSTLGQVKKGHWKHLTVAVKDIRNSFDAKYVKRKILMLDKLKHPYLVQLIAVAFSHLSIKIVMEYCEGSNLDDIIYNGEVKQRYNLVDEEKQKVSLKIAKGLDYLHMHNMHHQDLKPANIILKHFTLITKICDLGFSRSKALCANLRTTVGNNTHGTSFYQAPEALKGLRTTKRADIW